MNYSRIGTPIVASYFLVAAVFSSSGQTRTAVAEDPGVTITIDVNHPGAVIPADFAGLSFEVTLLLPDANGVHYFRPENQPLINIFHALGIHSLRIGGNTSDRDAKQLPGFVDLDIFFAFAKAAQVKVIYGLQLHNGDPQVAAQTVKYIMDHYAPLVDSFAIGQEPSSYPVSAVDNRPTNEQMRPAAEHYTYSAYAKEWKRFAEAIAAVVPNVKFCGPGVNNDARWTSQFITGFGQSNRVVLITAHLYAGGAADKVTTPENGRDDMLSGRFEQTYQKLFDGFASLAISNGLPYRLEEANSFYNAGAAGVSDTFASALWGLDFMYRWAEQHAAGLNFHTGDRVAAGASLRVAKYAVFFSTTNGYQICPLGYGLKAFNLGAHGKIIPVTMANLQQINLSAYAVLDEDGTVYVTVINKEHGVAAKGIKVSINQGSDGFRDGQVMYLTAPDQDVSAKFGQTLGGAEISNASDFAGNWMALTPEADGGGAGICHVAVPAASAAVIKLTPRNPFRPSASR